MYRTRQEIQTRRSHADGVGRIFLGPRHQEADYECSLEVYEKYQLVCTDFYIFGIDKAFEKLINQLVKTL